MSKSKKSAWKQSAVIAATLSVSPVAAWAELPVTPGIQQTGWKKKVPCVTCEPCIVEPGLKVPETATAPEAAAPAQPEAATVPGTSLPDMGAAPSPDVFAGALAVASASAVMSPNMFGDQFGVTSTGATGTLWTSGRLAGRGGIIFTPIGLPQVTIVDGSRNVVILPPSLVTVSSDGAKFSLGSYSSSVEQNVPGTSGPTAFSPNPTTVAQANAVLSDPALAPLLDASIFLAERSLAEDPNAILAAEGTVEVSGEADSGFYDETSLAYLLFIDSYILTNTTIGIPNPADGGNVGRTKIADDNNPLPRDRVIFNYDYFSNVPLVPGGWNVSRFSPGFEKTFFNQMTSVEVRVPFASTLDSSFAQGAESTAMELGNVNVTLKGLLLRTEQFAVAGGVGIGIPTAADTNVSFIGGLPLAQIANEAVFLTPYMAMLYTPTQRLFAQTWVASSFDTNGNPVQFNPDLQGLTSVGRLNDQTLLQLDGQIGYWLYQSNTGLLRGLAPFIELHYNTTLGDPDLITVNTLAGTALIGDLRGNIDDLTISAGWATQLANNFLINVGAVAPLKSSNDRYFDYQVGVRTNWFFGPTARDRDSARFLSTF